MGYNEPIDDGSAPDLMIQLSSIINALQHFFKINFSSLFFLFFSIFHAKIYYIFAQRSVENFLEFLRNYR